MVEDNGTGFHAASRVNHSLTANVERRALRWMANRAPGWLNSDHLTMLGLVAQFAAGALYAWARFQKWALLGVVVCLALNWLGDSMDGTLARVRCQQRPRYGFYVDHMVDVFGSLALMSGMAISGFLHWQIALAMLIAFLMLSCESYLATYTMGCFELSQGLFGPTEIRLLLVVGNLALLHSPYCALLGHRFLLFDVGGCIATVAMLLIAIRTTIRHTMQLYIEEPLP